MEIRVDRMTMAYGDNVAVHDLSITVAEGEMLVLLGPSGCGKTSTMRCVAGLETPLEGMISIGQHTVFDSKRGIKVPANKRRIGMVFQSYAIWPHRTVFENVAFPLKLQALSKSEVRERGLEVLELVGMADLADRGASLLSGGQMQRVALARSLAMRPRILLLDEPLSNLDARLRDKLRFELRELQQELGITSMYVTHDQSEALAIADRIAVMSDGKVVQLDTPEGMYTAPKTAFVADFLGVSNLFPARVEGRDGSRLKLQLLDWNLAVVAESADLPEAIDDDVFVLVRPEDVTAAEQLPVGTNTWVAKVLVASYLGSHVRYRVILDTGLVLEVASFGRGGVIGAGKKIHVHVPPESVGVVGR